MKDFSSKRHVSRIKPLSIALIVTKNVDYFKDEEYIKMCNELKGYVVKIIICSGESSMSDIKNMVDNLKREKGLTRNNGDKIIFLRDLTNKS